MRQRRELARRQTHRLDGRHQQGAARDPRALPQARRAEFRARAERGEGGREAHALDAGLGLDRGIAEDDVEQLDEVAAHVIVAIGDVGEQAGSAAAGRGAWPPAAEDFVGDVAGGPTVARDFLDCLLGCQVEGAGMSVRLVGGPEPVGDW